jgi:polyhydroxyalkanoate synthesis regulator protein
MKMFTPFAFRGDEIAPTATAPRTPEPPREDESLAEIKRQMAAMQAQLAALSSKR